MRFRNTYLATVAALAASLDAVMSYEVAGFKLGTLFTAADLSTKQYCGVVVDATGKVALAGANVNIIGVLQNKPIAGALAEIDCDGVTKGIAGAAIAAGDKLMVNATGQFLTLSGAAGTKCVGIALEAAAGASVVIAVKLGQYGQL